jgi:hypothetical protein
MVHVGSCRRASPRLRHHASFTLDKTTTVTYFDRDDSYLEVQTFKPLTMPPSTDRHIILANLRKQIDDEKIIVGAGAGSTSPTIQIHMSHTTY